MEGNQCNVEERSGGRKLKPRGGVFFSNSQPWAMSGFEEIVYGY